MRAPHKCRSSGDTPSGDEEDREESPSSSPGLSSPSNTRFPTPSAVLLNLNTWIGSHAEAKCIAVNPTRPEYLAVGANDPFVRMYDRRMLAPGDSVRMNAGVGLPDGCVRYYGPGWSNEKVLIITVKW